MEITYNQQEIQTILQDIYNLTGAKVSFYSANFKILESSLRKCSEYSYCDFIQNDPRLANNCRLSDELHLAKANNAQPYYIYTCHAGLIEIIIPIYDKNVRLGTIIVGTLRDKEMVYSSPEQIKKYIKTKKLKPELLNYYYKQPCLSHEEIRSLINLASAAFQNVVTKQLIQNKTDILFPKIVKYIEENINETITIEILCKKFSTNKNYLYKIFKTNSGKTVVEYITHQRINHAAYLLATTSLPITEIAFNVGYAESNYFTSVFKKLMHESPLKYRKNFLTRSIHLSDKSI